MLPSTFQRCLCLVLVLASVAVAAESAPPALSASQMAAADLGRRLDAQQSLLAAIREARDESLRRAAMQTHWNAMQAYMEQSLDLLVQQSASKGTADAVGCRLVGGQWRRLSFPGHMTAEDYVTAMQGHLARMRQDVLAMQTAQQGFVLEAVMREHWRSNYAFLQRARGLGWMFDSWMPADPAGRHLPEPESQGAKLTLEFCSVCHAVPHARLHTAQEWDAVMSTMDRHIVLSDTGVPMCVVVPTAAQLEAIHAHYSRHAR